MEPSQHIFNHTRSMCHTCTTTDALSCVEWVLPMTGPVMTGVERILLTMTPWHAISEITPVTKVVNSKIQAMFTEWHWVRGSNSSLRCVIPAAADLPQIWRIWSHKIILFGVLKLSCRMPLKNMAVSLTHKSYRA